MAKYFPDKPAKTPHANADRGPIEHDDVAALRLRDGFWITQPRAHGFEKTDINYRQEGERRYLIYEITMRTSDRRNYPRLAEHLSHWERVLEFNMRIAGA